MEYKINVLSIYEYGQRKDKNGNPHQEDWIYPAMGAVCNDKDRLFILCDGMGGHSAGEVASEAVCEAMSNTINSALHAGEKFSDALLLKAISDAYDLLDERDTCEDAQKKMGTTMTFLMLHDQGATIAHIGDSRVYHIRPKTGKKADIVFQTEDHSLVNDLVKAGELTPEEAETFPRKNVITRAMQPKLEYRCKADIKHVDNIMSGDYFYMCSDGMLEQTSDDNLCYMLNMDVTDEEKRSMLIRNSSRNKDNHSAHLIHILGVEPQPVMGKTSLMAPASYQEEVDDDIVEPEFETGSEESATASTTEETASIQKSTNDADETANVTNTAVSIPAASSNTSLDANPIQRQSETQKEKSRPVTKCCFIKPQRRLLSVVLCVAIAFIALVIVKRVMSSDKIDIKTILNDMFHRPDKEKEDKDPEAPKVDELSNPIVNLSSESGADATTDRNSSTKTNQGNGKSQDGTSATSEGNTDQNAAGDSVPAGQSAQQGEQADSTGSSSSITTATANAATSAAQGDTSTSGIQQSLGNMLNGRTPVKGAVPSVQDKIKKP